MLAGTCFHNISRVVCGEPLKFENDIAEMHLRFSLKAEQNVLNNDLPVTTLKPSCDSRCTGLSKLLENSGPFKEYC